MTKILITGASGYLGGRLGDYLSKQNSLQIILGTRKPELIINKISNAQYVKINWVNEKDLSDLCDGIDTVVHCAGMNAGDCSNNPTEAFHFNTVATGRLIESAIKANVKRFIYLSTAHVYSNPLTGNISEESEVLNFHPYASSHKAAEDILQFYHSQKKIEGIVARLTNSFGAPFNNQANCWMLIVNDLSRQAVSRNEIVLKSNGLQRRDFISLNDLCRAVSHLIMIPKIHYFLYNVGGEWSPTVWEMANIIFNRCKRILKTEPLLKRLKPSGLEKKQELYISIERIKSTGFQLENKIEEEIDNLLYFCKRHF